MGDKMHPSDAGIYCYGVKQFVFMYNWTCIHIIQFLNRISYVSWDSISIHCFPNLVSI
jgi:hypothetical protein